MTGTIARCNCRSARHRIATIRACAVHTISVPLAACSARQEFEGELASLMLTVDCHIASSLTVFSRLHESVAVRSPYPVLDHTSSEKLALRSMRAMAASQLILGLPSEVKTFFSMWLNLVHAALNLLLFDPTIISTCF